MSQCVADDNFFKRIKKRMKMILEFQQEEITEFIVDILEKKGFIIPGQANGIEYIFQPLHDYTDKPTGSYSFKVKAYVEMKDNT